MEVFAMPRMSLENNYYNKYRAPALENNNARDGNTAEDVRKARHEAAQSREADIRKRETEENRRNRYTAEESVGGTINVRV
jgi:septin family protein